MVAQEPVDPHLLAQLLEVAPARVTEAVDELRAAYEADERGFVLVEVAGGFRFQSHPDLAPYVERFALEGQSARLSNAALETLAIIAYKQPISRAQVSAVRGVNADGVIRTLTQRGYVDEIARDPGPGQAVLLGTTRDFLERMGLDSLEELPGVADFVPGPEVVEALERGLALDATEPAELFDGAEPTELLDEAEAPDHSPPPPDLGVAEAPEQIDPSDPPDPR